MPDKDNRYDPFKKFAKYRDDEMDLGDAAWETLIQREPEAAGALLAYMLDQGGFGSWRGDKSDSADLYNYVYYFFSTALRVSPKLAIDRLSDLFLPTMRPNEDKARSAVRALFAKRPDEARRLFVRLFRFAGLCDYRHSGESCAVFNFALNIFRLVREAAPDDAAKIAVDLFLPPRLD